MIVYLADPLIISLLHTAQIVNLLTALESVYFLDQLHCVVKLSTLDDQPINILCPIISFHLLTIIRELFFLLE